MHADGDMNVSLAPRRSFDPLCTTKGDSHDRSSAAGGAREATAFGKMDSM